MENAQTQQNQSPKQGDAGNAAGQQQATDAFNQMFNPQNDNQAMGMDEIGSNVPRDEGIAGQEGQTPANESAQQQNQPTQAAQQPSKEGQESEEGDTPTRYQYWQSEADKAKNELKQTQEQLDQFKTWKPVIDAVQEKPELLDTIEQSINQDGSQTELKPPEPPEKPAGYSEMDAFQDPDSDSYKHRMEMDKYRQDVIEFQNQKLQKFEQKEQQRQKQLQQQQQKRQQLQQAKQRLSSEYGLPDKASEQLIKEATNNDLVNNENLVKLFLMNHPEHRTPQLEQKLTEKGVLNQADMNFNTQNPQPQQPNPQQPNPQQQQAQNTQVQNPQAQNPQAQNANNQNFINNLRQNNNTPPSVTTASGMNNQKEANPADAFVKGLGKVQGNIEY